MKKVLLGHSGLSSFFLSFCKALLMFSLLSCIINNSSNAQNLIPNPSFELRDSCPSGWHEGFPYPSEGAMFAQDWFTPNAGTSDYYNSCAPLIPPNMGLPVSVPVNFSGYQQPRTGQAYAGGLVEELDNEYIESPLISPLVANHEVFVSFWINMGDRSAGAVDRFGAHLSPNPIELQTENFLDMLTPQIESPAGLQYMNSVNWTEISGRFTAAGNERWITLGNFHNRDILDTVQFAANMGFGYGSMYYLYEDVCVLDLDGSPLDFTVSDTTLCGSPTIDMNGRTGMQHYLWSDGSEDSSNTITAPGTYWVKSIAVNTCSLFTDTFHVTGTGADSRLGLGNDTSLCMNEALTIKVSKANFDTYLWNTGATTPSIEVNGPGTYFVTAFSDCGTGADTIRIERRNQCNCLFIPNAFSPNNDGENDRLQVNTNCPVAFFQLNIYNRFGEKVFSTNTPSVGWDGLYKGEYCDVGTYFYYINYRDSGDADAEAMELKGDIALLR